MIGIMKAGLVDRTIIKMLNIGFAPWFREGQIV